MKLLNRTFVLVALLVAGATMASAATDSGTCVDLAPVQGMVKVLIADLPSLPVGMKRVGRAVQYNASYWKLTPVQGGFIHITFDPPGNNHFDLEMWATCLCQGSGECSTIHDEDNNVICDGHPSCEPGGCQQTLFIPPMDYPEFQGLIP